jgi:hypothetical protein
MTTDIAATYPDFWASRRVGQSFVPMRVASGEQAAWVLDAWLPLLVAIEPSTLAFSEPLLLPRPSGASLEAIGVAVGEGSVWVAWPDGVVKVDERTRSAAAITLPTGAQPRAIAIGGGAAWVLADGILRIDPATGHADVLAPPVLSRSGLGFAQGSLWVGERTPERSIVSRVSPETGAVTGQVEIRGRIERIDVSDNGVWVRETRWEGPPFAGPIHTHLHRVDPVTLEVHEWELPKMEALFVGTEIWFVPHNAPRDPSGKAARELRRLDPRTGEATRSVRMPAAVVAMSIGAAGVWGLLDPPGRWPEAFRVDPETGDVAVLSLAGVDARPFLPEPPQEIDPEPVERELLDDVAQALLGERSPMEQVLRETAQGFEVDDVRLVGTFPGTEIAILFRTPARPDVRFGWRWPIWSDDGLYIGDAAVVIITNLEEAIRFEPGIPLHREPDASGIVWM